MNIQIKLSDLKEQFESLLHLLEVNHLILTSSPVDMKRWTWRTAELHLAASKWNKIPITQVIMAYDIEIIENTLTPKFYDAWGLANEWSKISEPFISDITSFTRRAENKYEMNDFFHLMYATINKALEKNNLEGWINEHDAANEEGKIFISIKNEYRSKKSVYLDLESYGAEYNFNIEFERRRLLLIRLLGRLMEIYSKHLFLPDIEGLPKVKYQGNMTDMFEVLVVLQASQKFDDFEKFRAVFCEIVGIDVKRYPKIHDDIKRRTQPMKFLPVLIDRISEEIKKTKKPSKSRK